MENLHDLAQECFDLSISNDLDELEIDRLKALKDLFFQLQISVEYQSQVSCVKNSITLIPESKWEESCQELAEDIGFIQENCPLTQCVDWTKWADLVRQDYQSVDFDGETYLFRG